MTYELQLYAMVPDAPTAADLVALAAESGLSLALVDESASPSWPKMWLRSPDGSATGFLVEISPSLDDMKARFREDRAAGDEIPDEILDAVKLYRLELADDADEPSHAAFVVAAWGLATLTEAVVFDPQEELFADADSFWALVTDEEFAQEVFEAGDDGPCEDEGGGGAGCAEPRCE